MSRFTYILSDFHMGTNERVNIYQSSVHTPLVKAMLRYILEKGSDVEDVVIAGDWFDTWNYLPDQEPPGATSIMQAQHDLFEYSDDGDFVSVMDSIQSELVFLNGNHDIAIDPREVANWFDSRSRKGRKLLVHNDPLKNVLYTQDCLRVEHGHLYSLFFAPDPGPEPFGIQPIGHFITRALALGAMQEMEKYNIPDAAHLGEHSGLTLETFLGGMEHILQIIFGKESIAEGVLDELLENAGVKPEDMSFVMPGGQSVSYHQVIDRYKDLWEDSRNNWERLRNDVFNSLDDVGRKVATAENPFVAFGHTHVPKLEQFHEGFHGVYMNCGFQSPEVKDLESQKKIPTFGEVEWTAKGPMLRVLGVDPHTLGVRSLMH